MALFITVGVVMVIETVTCDIILVRALAKGSGADMDQKLGVFIGCSPQSILIRETKGEDNA